MCTATVWNCNDMGLYAIKSTQNNPIILTSSENCGLQNGLQIKTVKGEIT